MSTVLDAVRTQLRLLEEAASRPDVDRHVVERNALHFILLAIRAEADPETQKQIDAHLQSTAQARTHLLELAEGWRCPSCQSRVPQGAAVKSKKLFIICKACDEQSPAAEAGARALAKHFSVSDAWDPKNNGFST